jgi:hypothetical protein
MIHDQARVEAIRACAAAQIELIKLLEAKIIKGKLPALDVARRQTGDIESCLLKDLERQDRTPAEEARWLDYAERMLQTWAPYLQDTEAQFNKYSGVGIEIVSEQ